MKFPGPVFSLFLSTLLLTACADRAPTSGSEPRADAGVISSSGPDRSRSILSVEPWTFAPRQGQSIPGRMIRTPSYRLFTTLTTGVTIDRLPLFQETALAQYRAAFGPLPPPQIALDTYLMATRDQWTVLSTQMFRDQADAFLRIPRGGFTYGGRAMLYDIGTRDTLALVAHEGWHQFTQQTFNEPLPIWLEEGIASYFEGYRWDSWNPARPEFLGWANAERFDQLRQSRVDGTLLPLIDLLSNSPQDMIAAGTQDALGYYAQVWALTHFLREGDHGKYRDRLNMLVADAAGGRLTGVIRRAFGERAASSFALRRRGTEVFKIYFSADLDEAQRRFDAFLSQVTQTGAKDRISAGKSPVRQ